MLPKKDDFLYYLVVFFVLFCIAMAIAMSHSSTNAAELNRQEPVTVTTVDFALHRGGIIVEFVGDGDDRHAVFVISVGQEPHSCSLLGGELVRLWDY